MVVFRQPRDVTFRFFADSLQDLSIGDDPTEVWSTSPTVQDADTWTEMFSQIFDQLGKAGRILAVYFYIKYRVRATSGTADVDERVRARNRNGEYQNISNELATANIGTSDITRVTSGWVRPRTQGWGQANFDHVPFEVQIQMRTNEANTARLQVSSDSYVRVVYEEM